MKWILVLLISLLGNVAIAEFSVVLESGAVWQNRNDVQIPPDQQGTRVELDEFGDGPFFYGRAELYYRPKGNHGFRLLYAPFTVNVNGTPRQDIQYDGETFTAGSEVDFTYTFNSYRATWFYAFWGHGDNQFNLGFTGKIRDAVTRFKQGSVEEDYTNVGFVPLLFIEYQKSLGKNWWLNFTMDGLAGGPGRAFDVALKVRTALSDSAQLGLGYRTLEGGADNDEVFTFSWFNYALADLVISF